MKEPSSIGALRVADLIASIGSDRIAPGAGSAGAVTLALGAACAGKAISISLKHRSQSELLLRALESCKDIARHALCEADRDARAFESYMHERSEAAAARLVEEGEALAHLIHALESVLVQVDSHIDPVVAGDLVAARALTEAARSIQARNEAEAKEP